MIRSLKPVILYHYHSGTGRSSWCREKLFIIGDNISNYHKHIWVYREKHPKGGGLIVDECFFLMYVDWGHTFFRPSIAIGPHKTQTIGFWPEKLLLGTPLQNTSMIFCLITLNLFTCTVGMTMPTITPGDAVNICDGPALYVVNEYTLFATPAFVKTVRYDEWFIVYILARNQLFIVHHNYQPLWGIHNQPWLSIINH